MLSEEQIVKLRNLAIDKLLEGKNNMFWDGYIMAIDKILEINE